MFTKIDLAKQETQPELQQYIVFKCGEVIFPGIYQGESKAIPFSMDNKASPIFLIEEWMPIRLWG